MVTVPGRAHREDSPVFDGQCFRDAVPRVEGEDLAVQENPVGDLTGSAADDESDEQEKSSLGHMLTFLSA